MASKRPRCPTAVECAKTFCPDVAKLDIQMPWPNGIQKLILPTGTEKISDRESLVGSNGSPPSSPNPEADIFVLGQQK